MKLTELDVKNKFNFDAIFKSLPKEFKNEINALHEDARSTFNLYRENGRLKDDIAPEFVKYFYDVSKMIESGKSFLDVDIESYVQNIVSRFKLNFVDSAKDDYEDHEDDDYEEDNNLYDFESKVEESFEECSEFFNK
jgi:hypothetical protein